MPTSPSSKTTLQLTQLGMVGYGEVGKIITAGLKSHMRTVQAWDLKFVDAAAQTAERAHSKLLYI